MLHSESQGLVRLGMKATNEDGRLKIRVVSSMNEQTSVDHVIRSRNSDCSRVLVSV